MNRAPFREILTQAFVFLSSATFLAWYIAAKISVWPWGARSF